MSDPTPKSIQQSFSRLQNGMPLFRKDICHIAWEYTFSSDQYSLLKEIQASNPQLKSTLIALGHDIEGEYQETSR